MNMQSENDLNELEESEDKRGKNPKFYFALLVCLAAVSVAGWSTYQTVKDFVTPQKTEVISSRRSKSQNKTSNKQDKNAILEGNSQSEKSNTIKKDQDAIPYDKNTSNKSSVSESKTNIQPKANEEEVQEVWNDKPETLQISYPSGNTVSKEFSDEKLVYCKTLGDWRAHEGTDFKAEVGSEVKAITSGTISDIYEDPSYGTTVVISHDGNFTAYYSGLGKNLNVEKGKRIKSEEKIGIIDKVPCEVLEGSHLHLMINKDGKFIDPILILDKEL